MAMNLEKIKALRAGINPNFKNEQYTPADDEFLEAAPEMIDFLLGRLEIVTECYHGHIKENERLVAENTGLRAQIFEIETELETLKIKYDRVFEKANKADILDEEDFA